MTRRSDRRRASASTAVFCLGAMLLVGCTTPPGSTSGESTGPTTSTSDRNGVGDAAEREAGDAAVADTGPPLPELDIDADPDRLMGLERVEVAMALGRPRLVRREPPAEVWHYQVETCVLDVMLFAEGDAPSTVRHVESRDRRGRRFGTEDCLERVIAARQPATAPLSF